MSPPEIRVLGTCGVLSNGTYAIPASRMVRGLITVFAADTNRMISGATLCRALGDDPPESAPSNLRTHISRLRRLLAEHSCSIVTRRGTPTAYSLRIAEDQLDLSRFRQYVQKARNLSAACTDDAMVMYESALDLWRGGVEGGLPDTVTVQTITTGWNMEYVRALETYAELAIALGRTGKLVDHLYAHAMRCPHDPNATRLLMSAVAADGRTSVTDLPVDLQVRINSTIGEPTPA